MYVYVHVYIYVYVHVYIYVYVYVCVYMCICRSARHQKGRQHDVCEEKTLGVCEHAAPDAGGDQLAAARGLCDTGAGHSASALQLERRAAAKAIMNFPVTSAREAQKDRERE